MFLQLLCEARRMCTLLKYQLLTSLLFGEIILDMPQ